MTESPKCSCGKGLHRRMDNGPARVRDSFAWCRNQDCKNYNLPQRKSRFKSIAQVKLEKIKEEANTVEDVVATALSGLVPEKETSEPEIVVNTRARIKAAMLALEQTYSRSIIGLSMAIVAQEMGSDGVANALIVEYDLEKQYGIKKRFK